jgi:hypothetical protein
VAPRQRGLSSIERGPFGFVGDRDGLRTSEIAQDIGEVKRRWSAACAGADGNLRRNRARESSGIGRADLAIDPRPIACPVNERGADGGSGGRVSV